MVMLFVMFFLMFCVFTIIQLPLSRPAPYRDASLSSRFRAKRGEMACLMMRALFMVRIVIFIVVLLRMFLVMLIEMLSRVVVRLQ